MSPKPKDTSLQTEIDFSHDFNKIKSMTDDQIQEELKRLRHNAGTYMGRGDIELAKKATTESNDLLSELLSRDSSPDSKRRRHSKSGPRAKTSPRKDTTFLKNRMQEFYSHVPRPTYLEQAMFVTAEWQKWNGKQCDFLRTVGKISGHSKSILYRLFFAGQHLTGEAVAAIAQSDLANKNASCLNSIAHLPEADQSNPAIWKKILKKSRNSYRKTAPERANVPVSPIQTESLLPDQKVLAREDYHKIARICGAQNQELYLKIKEVISNNHKGDLQTQVDVVSTLGHILKELKSINEILTNSSTKGKIVTKFETTDTAQPATEQ